MNQESNKTLRLLNALLELNNLLNGNRATIAEMINLFMDNTPRELASLKRSLRQSKWTKAAAVVHRIKASYAYWGEDDATVELSLWEKKLLDASVEKDPDFEIKHWNTLKNLTQTIIEELQLTDYLRNEAEPNTVPARHQYLILMAEDESVNGLIFELFIKKLGGHAILAKGGDAFVSLALKNTPDLIFIDIHTPVNSDIEAIRKLRKEGIQCPIISLSAADHPAKRQELMEAGATNFLVKPVNLESINSILLRYLHIA